ncbi:MULTISPECIES: pantoate kinase [unclassified Haladaptatus]|uniref:pantoate kinase n=1 Tax=unclassified Haladaptatus TaxID=2622732 RepID=UPI0023E78662|nr:MULTISPECIES: pantoate kinase [unclassified Haladaptatus]
MSRERAQAFVPGHVTGFFSAHQHDDPLRAGSRGAGLTLTDGVHVTVEPAAETTVTLDGRPTEMTAVNHVLSELGVSCTVTATTDLPISAGFGVSGATALGTALGANAVFDLHRSENTLVGLAHAGEVQAGTGLGDVVAQARGGIPIRLEPGAPGFGTLDGIPARGPVEYCTFGSLSTADIITGDTVQLTAAGERALSFLMEEPTLTRLMVASRRFAREADLLTAEVETAIDAVQDAGGQAAMAMLGQTVFALGTGLSDAGYDAHSCRIHPPGATLEE